MGAIWQPVNILYWCLFLWWVQRNKTGVNSEFTLIKYQPWQTKKEKSVRRKKQLMDRLLRPWGWVTEPAPIFTESQNTRRIAEQVALKAKDLVLSTDLPIACGLGGLLNPCYDSDLTHFSTFKRCNLEKRWLSPEDPTLRNEFKPYKRGGRNESLSFTPCEDAAVKRCHQESSLIPNAELASTLTLTLPCSRTMRTNCPFFVITQPWIFCHSSTKWLIQKLVAAKWRVAKQHWNWVTE